MPRIQCVGKKTTMTATLSELLMSNARADYIMDILRTLFTYPTHS